MNHAPGAQPGFPPETATHLVKLACDLPEKAGQSLSLWTCGQLARTMQSEGLVESISPQSVQRILHSHKLKPWRVHYWLHPKTPRDKAFHECVLDIMGIYTHPRGADELAFCVDEKTSLQPRTRTHETRPPLRGNKPALLEHEYERKGALHLLAAFNIGTGEAVGIMRKRKRQLEFIELLEVLEAKVRNSIRTIHLICDNVSMHHGKGVRAWLDAHPRFKMHWTPKHCSWINQIEQWFSILQRFRLKAPNFKNLYDLELKTMVYIQQWNERARPFNWTKRSFDKILAKVDTAVPMAA